MMMIKADIKNHCITTEINSDRPYDVNELTAIAAGIGSEFGMHVHQIFVRNGRDISMDEVIAKISENMMILARQKEGYGLGTAMPQ